MGDSTPPPFNPNSPTNPVPPPPFIPPRRWEQLTHRQRWRLYPALDKSRVLVERNQWKAQSNSARAAAAQKFRWAVCTPDEVVISARERCLSCCSHVQIFPFAEGCNFNSKVCAMRKNCLPALWLCAVRAIALSSTPLPPPKPLWPQVCGRPRLLCPKVGNPELHLGRQGPARGPRAPAAL